MKNQSFALFAVLLCGCFLFAEEYQCEFGRGKWNAEDFFMVKSPRWENVYQWAQEEDAHHSAAAGDEKRGTVLCFESIGFGSGSVDHDGSFPLFPEGVNNLFFFKNSYRRGLY